MKNFLSVSVAFYLAMLSPAFAEWSLASSGNWVSETPTALGVSTEGVHGLHLTCSEGAPFIYVKGYPANPGANRQESFTVSVDGSSFSVTGEHSPPDGLWTGTPTPDLIGALKRGRVAEVTPEGAPTITVALRGSSRAISAALDGCPASDSPESDSAGKIVLLGQMIAEACGGGYSLADGHEFTALLDGDDRPDIVLDWAGVTCDDRSRGRGAGRCGAIMCSITVVLTETKGVQELLGLRPRAVQRAFGKSALRTTALPTSCPDGASECFVDWRWTGSKLEAVR